MNHFLQSEQRLSHPLPSSIFCLSRSHSLSSPSHPIPSILSPSISFFLSSYPLSPLSLFPLLLYPVPSSPPLLCHSQVVDLIPGGRNVPVTDDNKAEYIRLVAHHRMTAAIRSQVRTRNSTVHHCLCNVNPL
jgi:HECT-domain (ubiquitin-transferase)